MTETQDERDLRNLLAVIHRDGGHYVADHGMEKAVEDAMMLVPNLRADNECLRKQVLAYQKDLALARKVFYWIIQYNRTDEKIKRAAERCIKELKQK
jgi:hypothetical protein